MSRTTMSPSLAAIDRRTLLARAKDELTESLPECEHAQRCSADRPSEIGP